MCMECAIQRGISPDPRSIEASIGHLFNEITSITARLEKENNRLCPVCGTSLGSIRKKGEAGCPECYAVFKDAVRKYLSVRGISGSYTGSMPMRLASFRSVLTDRMALQNKLNEAVEHEDYEKAAMYRDYLRALEKSAVAGTQPDMDSASNGQEG